MSWVFGAGDYVLLTSCKKTLGVGMYEDGEFSMLNVKKAAAGETVVPIALKSFDNTLLEYKSIIAVDKEHEQLVLSYLEHAGDKKYKEKTALYDMETMSIPTSATAIGFKEIKGETLLMDYKKWAGNNVKRIFL